MLETKQTNQFGIEVTDTTVSVQPGTARVGNLLMEYPGGRVQFDDIANFAGDTSSYQYSALYVQNTEGATDLTSSVSATASSVVGLSFPEMPSDSTNPYSPVHPIGLFTFWSADGTEAELVSYSKIV